MEKWYSKKSRMDLSRILHHSRAVYTLQYGSVPICPICNEAITGVGDMHEALLPKSAVMKTSQETQDMINHACNCVIRHHICPGGKMSHTGGTGGEDVLTKCLEHLVYWEGKSVVEEYLQFMADQTVIAGRQALVRFYGHYPELVKAEPAKLWMNS